MGRARRITNILVLALAALVVAGWMGWRAFRPQPVTAQALVRGVAVDAAYATGTVEPEERIAVKARTGGRLAEVRVREGKTVRAGDLLARIDEPARRFALDRGRVQLRNATAQAAPSSPQLAALDAQLAGLDADLELASAELVRTERLVASGALPEADLDRQRASRDRIVAQRAAVIAQRRSLALDLGASRAQLAETVASLASDVVDTEVRAPMDGVVLVRNVDPGEVVTANQVLFEIGDVGSLHVELDVDEADIARVRAGEDASHVALTLYAFEGRIFDGVVYEILPEPDRARRSYVAKVRLLDPPEGLRNGMTVEANVIVGRKNDALLAPASALVGDRLWVVEDGRAVQREVTVGVRDLATVEIVRGAREGELAIVDAERAALRPGGRVSPREKAPAARAMPAHSVSMAP